MSCEHTGDLSELAGDSLTLKQLKSYIKKVDTNGDGALNAAEFRLMMRDLRVDDTEAEVVSAEASEAAAILGVQLDEATNNEATTEAFPELPEGDSNLLCTGDCRTIHGVDWEKVMDDKVQSLDSGVADTERRMKRATGAFRAFDVDGSGSLDTAELIQNKSEIGKTMKLKYTPSDDEIRLVRIAAGRALFCEAVVCVCSS